MSQEFLDISLVGEKICKSGFKSLCLDAIDGSWWGKTIEVILYVFSIVCLQILGRDFLVPSLEILCQRFKMKEDAAGATFIAFGSSAAELLITFITVLHGSTFTDIGIGSVFGASMFGSLLIPGICAMISQKPISLSALVILRDVLFYAGALIVTVIFLADGVFYPLECCLLLAVFVAYIISIFLSPLVKRSFRVNKEAANPQITTAFLSAPADSDDDAYTPIDQLTAADAETAVEETFLPSASAAPSSRVGLRSSLANGWGRVSALYDRFVRAPCAWVFHHLIPQCTAGTRFEYLYPITLVETLLFLFVVTFVTSAICQRWVTMAVSFTHSANMGTLIGMFLVAGLLSIPNGQYAIEMTRKGHGATAINNTFSSQILNISLGLGLPLLIAGLKSGEGVVVPANKIVSWSAILLAMGSLAFIGMTLLPAMVKKLDSCTLSSLSGQILVGLTVTLMATFAIISLISSVSLTNKSLLCKCAAVLVLGYLNCH
ncbi:hypothetical protein WA538_001110 [Blastocystis sp. DL]